MGIRSTAAAAAGRLVRWGLHDVLHRNASQLPGRIALEIDDEAIAHLRSRAKLGSIVVCGTNGKTTTTNVLASAIEAQGLRVLCNRDGANMAAGVTTALLSGDEADWAVLEADELSTIRILPQLQPTYLVLLNLFRDQLDRAGEIDHVQDVIVQALASSPHTTLMVCADDPLSWGIARRAQRAGTRTVTFGIAERLDLPMDRVAEARFCQECGAELTYEYRAYAQLGKFSCPACDFARPPLDHAANGVRLTATGLSFVATSKEEEGQTKTVPVHADFGGTYMVYNLLAVWAAASAVGVEHAAFQRAIDEFDPGNGRLQRFQVAGREVILNLAKNPTGLNQNITLLLADERPKAAFVVVNDDFNDGRDISWIWDVDFERLSEVDGLQMIAGGHRANDVQVRLKYAGIEATIAQSVTEALCQVVDVSATSDATDMPTDASTPTDDAAQMTSTPAPPPLYVLTNYSALWPAKAELEELQELSRTEAQGE